MASLLDMHKPYFCVDFMKCWGQFCKSYNNDIGTNTVIFVFAYKSTAQLKEISFIALCGMLIELTLVIFQTDQNVTEENEADVIESAISIKK